MSNGVIHSKASKKSLALTKHPPYLKICLQMISDAIVTLKGRNGSSQYVIRKFIEKKHKNQLPVNFKKMLLTQLKKVVASHKLVKVKASYKLPSAAKPKPKAATKRKPAAKPKIAPSKLAAKTKPASKVVTKKAPAKKKPPKAKPGSAKMAGKPNLTPESFEEAAVILGG